MYLGKKLFSWGGFSKILRNFQSGSLKKITSDYKVGGWGEKGQKYAYVIFEWSLMYINIIPNLKLDPKWFKVIM